MKRKLYFLFSQSVFNFENMKYEVSGGNRFEIPRCARNDGVVYETGNAAAVNAEPLFCPCAAAIIVGGQRVIPNVVRNLEQGGENAPRCPRGAVAHREADGGEYHPLGWLAGMRVCRVVREPAYSKISYSKDCVLEKILRLPCRADLEDGRAGGYSMSLDFFAYFFYQEKKYEKNYICY